MSDKPTYLLIAGDCEDDLGPHYLNIDHIESFHGENGNTSVQMVSGKHHWVKLDVLSFINLINAKVVTP